MDTTKMINVTEFEKFVLDPDGNEFVMSDADLAADLMSAAAQAVSKARMTKSAQMREHVDLSSPVGQLATTISGHIREITNLVAADELALDDNFAGAIALIDYELSLLFNIAGVHLNAVYLEEAQQVYQALTEGLIDDTPPFLN